MVVKELSETGSAVGWVSGGKNIKTIRGEDDYVSFLLTLGDWGRIQCWQ